METPREDYDLLIAAAFGAIIGAGLTLLVRRGPRARSARKMLARRAARVGRYGAEQARHVARRGEAILDRVPLDDVREAVGDYLESARNTIDDVVSRELKDLRKAVRRQRKRLGV